MQRQMLSPEASHLIEQLRPFLLPGRIEQRKIQTINATILGSIRGSPVAGSKLVGSVSHRLGMFRWTVADRMNELVKDGHIEIKGYSTRGQKEVLYGLTDSGEVALQKLRNEQTGPIDSVVLELIRDRA